jgi:hypothetical protein
VDKPLKSDSLQRAAQRASQRPFFIASALLAYQTLGQLGEDELAEFLGCPLAALPKLALCRLPDAMASDFRAEVERIASYSGANSVRLAQILREVESTAALHNARYHQAVTTGQGALMAARDRIGATQLGDPEHPETSNRTETEPHSP